MDRSLKLSNGIPIRCKADEHHCKEVHAGDLVMYRSYDWSGFWKDFEFIQIIQKAKDMDLEAFRKLLDGEFNPSRR